MVERLRPEDRLFLYTTSRAYGRGYRPPRVMGKATVASPVVESPEPLVLGGRVFPLRCQLTVDGLAPFGQGVPLGPLVPALESIPDTQGWRFALMRPVVPLTSSDAALLESRLEPLLVPYEEAAPTYVEWGESKTTDWAPLHAKKPWQ
jgi:hypothetical protein